MREDFSVRSNLREQPWDTFAIAGGRGNEIDGGVLDGLGAVGGAIGGAVRGSIGMSVSGTVRDLVGVTVACWHLCLNDLKAADNQSRSWEQWTGTQYAEQG